MKTYLNKKQLFLKDVKKQILLLIFALIYILASISCFVKAHVFDKKYRWLKLITVSYKLSITLVVDVPLNSAG